MMRKKNRIGAIHNFDATGKHTKVNGLGEIGVALADFIKKEAES